MSRPSAPTTGRSLTLTEELERLEQSITLTLQEIDSNFSKAHRIVTTSILPVVEQYGEHSRAVWDASRFWKQFFEASANVSLSGYEERNGTDDVEGDDTTIEHEGEYDDEDEDVGVDDTRETTRLTDSMTGLDLDEETETGEHMERQDQTEHSLLDGHDNIDELSGSTPRPPSTKTQMHFANLDSPYETLRREMHAEKQHQHTMDQDDDEEEAEEEEDDDDNDISEIATATARLPDMSMTPRSPSKQGAPTPTARSLFGGPNKSSKDVGHNKDPLLHRVLNKNYRIQATPHKHQPRISPAKHRQVQQQNQPQFGDQTDQTRRALWAESPTSSPEIAAPTLRTNLYSGAGTSPSKGRLRQHHLPAGPRTPGVSVQTPATAKKIVDVFSLCDPAGTEAKGKGKAMEDPDEITWESSSDGDDDIGPGGRTLFGGISPPKTIQFALPPGRLLQTPAREASRRIVGDILLTAGAAPEYVDGDEDFSPTMVKVSDNILDDTF